MTRSRHFSATYNNPEMTGQEWVDIMKSKGCTYAICQLEKGENGTPHLQCAFGFQDAKSLISQQKYLKNHHVEPSKNAMKAYNYCKKEGALEGPWIHGVPPAKLNVKGDKASRNKMLLEIGAEKAVDEGLIDIKDYGRVKANIDLYNNCTAEPKALDGELGDHNVWIWGTAGSGKTRYVVENFPGYYEKDKSKYWNGYTNQEVVLIDDIEENDHFMLGHLKKWCQHKEFQAEDKFGQMRRIRPKRIFVTSNFHFRTIWQKEVDRECIDRRFSVKELN